MIRGSRATRIGAVALAVTAGAGWLIAGPIGGNTPDVDAQGAHEDVETAKVQRETLRQSDEVKGSGGFGETVPVTPTAQGTITWAPDKGAVLRPGDPWVRVDEQPVFWASGHIPMYRTLDAGRAATPATPDNPGTPATKRSEGTDVAQLQRFLAAQGYLTLDGEPDGIFGPAVRAAVKNWQLDHGLEQTGAVDATQLQFLPYDELRVAETPKVGSPAQAATLGVTANTLEVTVDADVDKRRLFGDDSDIEVELADGSRHPATVRSIEKATTQDAPGDTKYKVTLDVEVPDNTPDGDVTVHVDNVVADNALTVPVSALVALAEGGYAVEVVGEGGSRQYRPVELGKFADGRVAITGEIAEGDDVVVAS